MNPRTPVVAGVGQVLNRSKDLDEALEPIEMMLKAVHRAEEDSEAKLLGQVGSVRVIRGVWDYGNPAGFIAERIGRSNSETMGTCLLYTSPSPRDVEESRMPSSA